MFETSNEELPAWIFDSTNLSVRYCHLPAITVLSEVGQDVIVEQATEGVRRSNLLGLFRHDSNKGFKKSS